ncbi:MAG: RsmE family RNA methyltransferase [Ginsengibacter sp.]
MQLPYFYEENIPESGSFFLTEETSKHIAVLRMKEGEVINITNGKGILLSSFIILLNKKKVEVAVTNKKFFPRPNLKITIAISPVKNNNRFEWFLEKATEIGISEIIPLLCDRSEKSTLKTERLNNIVISAMLQSRQSWMPLLKETTRFSEIIKDNANEEKFIAHCNDIEKKALKDFHSSTLSRVILIGPEGDFTDDEISAAIQQNFIAVSLGETRLRTETAGIVAAALLMNR